MNLTQVAAFTGAATGLIGSILGIINTVVAIKRDRVRLCVIPMVFQKLPQGFVGIKDAEGVSPEDNLLCINIVNIGSQPCTIVEVGFTRAGKENRVVMVDPNKFDGGKLPRRVESQSAFIAFGGPFTKDQQLENLQFGYARTASGKVFKGGSGALNAFCKYRKAERLQQKSISDRIVSPKQ